MLMYTKSFAHTAYSVLLFYEYSEGGISNSIKHESIQSVMFLLHNRKRIFNYNGTTVFNEWNN